MKKRWILLGGAVALVVAGYLTGAWQHVTDEQTLRRLLLESGPWGGALFVLLFTFLVGLGSPGLLLIVPASIVWPFAEASALVYCGAIGSSLVGFFVARYGAREWIEHYLPAKVRAWDERLETNGFGAALTIRLLFFCAPWTHWVLGLSRVKFGPYMLASVLGFIPWSLFWVYMGRAGFDWMREQSTGVLIGLAAVVVSFLVVQRIRGRRIGTAVVETVMDVENELTEPVVNRYPLNENRSRGGSTYDASGH